jgi:hypothetical protein
MPPLTKQQIAIKCHYRRKKLGLDRNNQPINRRSNPPSTRMVLDGKVKLTPRRREILWHIAFSDDLRWALQKDWSDRWSNSFTFVPHLGGVAVSSVVLYLLRTRLIRYSPLAPRPDCHDRHAFIPPIPLITPRGMAALLECFEYQLKEE